MSQTLPAPPGFGERKRPGLHKVRSHQRGLPSNSHRKIHINSYKRGSGKVLRDGFGSHLGKGKAQDLGQQRDPGSYLSPKNNPNGGTFDIRVTYTTGKSDRFTAKVGDFDSAIDVAVKQARSTPASIRIARN